MKKILAISIVISLFITGFVQAIAVKVSPSEVKIEAETGVLAKKEIIIENPDNNVAFYEVYPDNFSLWIKIKPESFILEARESQKVVLEIKNEELGIFSTMISVVAKSLSERKFKANSGVKIPLEIRISPKEEKEVFLAMISQSFRDFFQGSNLVYILGVILIVILAVIKIVKKICQRKKILDF